MTDDSQFAAPSTPAAAQTRLTELSADKTWGAAVLNKDPVAFGQFQKLTTVAAGNPTVETLAHELSDFNGAKMVDQFLTGTLPSGFPDLSTPAGAELAQILKGEKTITPELHRMVQAKLDSMIADREWGKRFEAKDQTAMREFQLATTLLTAQVVEKAA
jgi:hypothetical protein